MPDAVTLLSVTCSDRELNHFTRQPCFSVSGDPPSGILPLRDPRSLSWSHEAKVEESQPGSDPTSALGPP